MSMLDYDTDEFVGREKAIESFSDWLTSTDPHKPKTLFLHSEPKLQKKGGVGKTRLLRRFADIAKQQEDTTVAVIDFLNVDDRSGVTIAKHIVEALRTTYSNWFPTAFDDALRDYEESLRDQETPLKKGSEDLLNNIRVALQQDLQTLAVLFTGTQKQLVVFIDTFEVIGQDLQLIVLKNDLTFPDAYGFPYIRFVIAGREAPDWEQRNWAGREHEVQLFSVQPFSQQEMLLYYQQKQLADDEYAQISEHVERLYELTEGRPILISLIADLFPNSGDSFDLTKLLNVDPKSFEKQLVLRINDLNRPVNLAVLAMAHVYHRFNRDLFIWIFDDLLSGVDIPFASVWNTLLKLSFVRRAYNSDDVVLHDEMRELVYTYNWPEVEKGKVRGPQRRDLSLSVIRYYQKEIEENEGLPISQTYIVEQLYHKLFADLEQNWQSFDRLFKEAIKRWQIGYARHLLREALKFESHFSVDQRANLFLHEIRLLRKEERYEEALKLYERYEKIADASWLAKTDNAITFLFEGGECYRFASRLDEAFAYFDRILNIDATRGIPPFDKAETVSRMGYIHEQRADFDKAAICYEDSLSIFKEESITDYIDVLNNLCLVYCYQGKIEEAHPKCIVALRTCREAEDASQVMLADSFNTVGTVQIYRKDFDKAEQHIREAQGIFERIQNKQGMAMVYHILGDLEMAKKNYAQARLWFEWSYRISLGINVEIELKSLHKRAQADAHLQHWEEAIWGLENAIKRASEVKNLYQETEARLKLVEILDEHGKLQEAEDIYQQVLVQAKGKKYYYRLLGNTQRRRAYNRYYEREYEQAFQYFGSFCYLMALFSQNEYKEMSSETRAYEEAIHETIEYLLTLDEEMLSDAWNTLSKFWDKCTPKLGQKAVPMQKALAEAKIPVDVVRRNLRAPPQ